MSSSSIQTITIYGPGLLGGSIAKAVRAVMPGAELRLWARRQQPLELAKELGITEHTYTDALAAARGADLIILATPIGVFEDLIRRILPGISRECIVTDIGSVKAYVHRTTGALLTERGRIFIGSHPMAGGENQGLEHAREDLLHGATVAITNPHGAPAPIVEKLEQFWSTLGGKTWLMDPVNHDHTVACISHMPHILAGLCARGAAEGNSTPLRDLQRLASSGFRDTTRVCAGGAAMWADILWENDVAVREVLHHCITDLQNLIDLLENQDKGGVHEWLERARINREQIRDKEEA